MRERLLVPKSGHPLIQKLYRLMNKEGITLKEMCERTGISLSSIKGWRYGQSPGLDNLEACFNVLGRTLTDKPLKVKS
jgi:transcriptional regulator with XRE-family HTH domain